MPVDDVDSTTAPPAQNVVGPLAVIVGVVFVVMFVVALPLAVQPALFTVTLICALPLAPTLYVMLVVPCPAVIVPLVMLHTYVDPEVGLTMFAASPVAFGHAFAGALICALGGAHAMVAAAENCEVPSPKEARLQFASLMAVASATSLSPTLTPIAAALIVVVELPLLPLMQFEKRNVFPCPRASALKKSMRMPCVVADALAL